MSDESNSDFEIDKLMSLREELKLGSGRYSDLVIECKGRKWNVHRVIICPQSDFFEKACEGKFKEGRDRLIVLKEVDPNMINRMISWFYTYKYDHNPSCAKEKEIPGVNPELVINAHMYAIADCYGAQGLKKKAIKEFSKVLDNLEERHRPLPVDSLMPAIQVIYTTTPSSDRDLRDALLTAISSKPFKEDLLAQKTFLDLFQSGLAEGQFTKDLLVAWMTCTDNDCPAQTFIWHHERCKQTRPRNNADCTVECAACKKTMLGWRNPHWD